MKFDLSREIEFKKAVTYMKMLLDKKHRIELKRIHKKRSSKHNSYVHVLFTCYAVHFGHTMDEAKNEVKKLTGYTYVKNNVVNYVKTSEMDDKELSDFISKFRNMSAKNGCYLPEAHEATDDLINELDKSKEYL